MKLVLPEKVYEAMRWLVCIVIPAALAFYGILGGELGIPYTEKVLKIGAAFNTMLGTIFMISKLSYDIQSKKEEKANE